ncbi:MAG: hypothetical protein JST84_00990 [Acidobacteria bacterium]|nr:hypothetical protein [Acidobacteriota bacterium]
MSTTQSRHLFVMACLFTILCLPSLAQPHGKRSEGKRGGPPREVAAPPEPGFRFVSSLMRFSGKTVKNTPFSATAETEFVQTLSDGSRIARKSTAFIARDSEGRTRREQTLGGIGPLVTAATADEAPKFVFIHDPLLDVEYIIDLNRRTVEKKNFHHRPPPANVEFPKPANAKMEALGKQTLEGVEAEGTRSVITIPVGQIGNDRALEIVSEQWYAPALQEIILSKYSDPRFGENTYRLTNINRREPDAALFRPPVDFTANGLPFGKDGPRGRGRHPDDEN